MCPEYGWGDFLWNGVRLQSLTSPRVKRKGARTNPGEIFTIETACI